MLIETISQRTRQLASLTKDRAFDAFEFSLFGVGFIHAVLDERPAVTSRQVLLVGEVLAGIHLILLAHFVKLLIAGFFEALLYKVLAVVSFEGLVVGHIVTGFDLVLLR